MQKDKSLIKGIFRLFLCAFSSYFDAQKRQYRHKQYLQITQENIKKV